MADGKPKDGTEPQAQLDTGLMTMATWLADCKARGVKPIPADDAVWRYAADVGIGDEIIALHWWQFKRKRLSAAKKQRGHKGWAQTFRNSVEGNWFRLWLMKPGQPAGLSTVGLQALAAFSAEQTAEQASARAVPA